MKTLDLTVQKLKALLHYEPATGVFTWRPGAWPTVVGRRAGGTNAKGYTYIQINKVGFRAARLAWFYTHGAWPIGEVDHINRNRSDDRLENLRDVSKIENLMHRDMSDVGWTGSREGRSRGVYCHKGRWIARLTNVGVRENLGSFGTKDQAVRARDAEVSKRKLTAAL